MTNLKRKVYEDDVTLFRLPKDTKIYTQDSVEIPILSETKITKWVLPGQGVFDSIKVVRRYILLRSNMDHVLNFKYEDQEKRVHLYPRLSAGWFILDCLTGTFFVDLYTGNWNHFKSIDFAK